MADFAGYLALGSIDDAGAFVEIAGGAYARQALVLRPDGSGTLKNTADLTFPVPTGADWPGFSAYGIFVSPTFGAPLLFWTVPSASPEIVRVGRRGWSVKAGRIVLDFPAVQARSSHGTPVITPDGLNVTSQGILGVLVPQRRVLALSSSFPPIYGADGSEKRACSVLIPAGSVAPDSVLEIAGLVSFPTPSYVTHNVVCRIGGQPVAQSFGTAAVGGLTFETKLFVSADRKSAVLFSPNMGGVLQPDVGETAPFTASGVSGAAIDFAVDNLFEVCLYPNNNEVAQLMGISLVNEFSSAIPTRSLAAKPLAFWGDSWIAGSGSANGGVPGRILRNNPGSQVVNLGVGGQNAQQIADRFERDAVYGRLVPVVIECGLNNIGSDDPGTDGNVVMASIARMVASLAPGVPYLVCNVPQTVWPTASGNGQWITAHNTGLLARYGQRVVNWRDAISTNPDGTMPDSVKHDPVADPAHPNDAGYDLITAATQAKLAQFAMV